MFLCRSQTSSLAASTRRRFSRLCRKQSNTGEGIRLRINNFTPVLDVRNVPEKKKIFAREINSLLEFVVDYILMLRGDYSDLFEAVVTLRREFTVIKNIDIGNFSLID